MIELRNQDPGLLSEAAIALTNVVVVIKKATVLNDVSLFISRGTVFGLVGPSGGGKTTLLRAIATLVAPTAGSVRISDWDTRQDQQQIRRIIGYLPASTCGYADLTAREYLGFYGDLFGLSGSRLRESINDLLELFGLGDRAEALLRTLTPGSRRCLDFARCLLHDPDLLLLDEPWTGLDPEARSDFSDVVRELSLLGKSVVIASNELAEMAGVCTRFGLLDRGRVVAEIGSNDVFAADQSLGSWYASVLSGTTLGEMDSASESLVSANGNARVGPDTGPGAELVRERSPADDVAVARTGRPVTDEESESQE